MPTSRQPGPSEEFLVRSSHVQFRTRRRRFIDIVVLVFLAALACAIFFAFRPQRVDVAISDYHWVQMLEDENGGVAGGRVVRSIVTKGDRCPTVTEEGEAISMHTRPAPVRSTFPILLCEAMLRGDSRAQIDKIDLPARPTEPNDIVVIGDTGCRMVHWEFQNCGDENKWPFEKIASSATRKILDEGKQSFILHLGDFHYREDPCTDSNSRCGGSPYGDNWATWRAEFFEPARKLLPVAPWVIMRGNHEECDRAGAGWIFFFALPNHRKTNSACDNDLPNYKVSIGTTDDKRPRILLVMDMSCEKSQFGVKERCKQYTDSLTPLDQRDSELWLALHQPLWLRKLDGKQDKPASPDLGCGGKLVSAIAGIRAKFEAQPNERLARLVLSGDTHAFQFFWPKTASTPIQIVAGNGGTALDRLYKLPQLEAAQQTEEKCTDVADKDKEKNQVEVTENEQERDSNVKSFGIEGSSLTFVQHGFTVMHRKGSTWTATEFDSNGRFIVACRFSELLSMGTADNKPPCDPNS
jgi:Calcineurin-like phosphoesterase